MISHRYKGLHSEALHIDTQSRSRPIGLRGSPQVLVYRSLTIQINYNMFTGLASLLSFLLATSHR